MLALHTWTLDTTPLAEVLRVAKRVGWDGIELRRVDFARAAEAGKRAEDVLALVEASGLGVACVGVEPGWMGAEDAERERLFGAFAESCRWAAELGARTVMSPVDRGRLDLRRAATSLRAVGELAVKHGVRLALEFNSQAEQLNTLASVREVLALANDPSCGLLLDTYHLGRSGATLAEIEKVRSPRSPTCSSATCRGAASSPARRSTVCRRAGAACPSRRSLRSWRARAIAAS